MANRIRVHVSETIIGLYQQGWRKLRIAHELGVDVKTVRRHIRESKSLHVPTGDGGVAGANSLIPPTGRVESNSLVVPAGRQSQCEAYRERIEAGLERGLSAQRLYQDLVCEEGFEGGYDAVKRFTRRLRKQSPQRFYRFEREPGEEAQVDFGRGAPVVGPDGRRKNTHVFRIVLSHSRKAYSEAILRQTTEAFIRCLENAFRYFGGVPKTLVPDNLRAAVSRADWFDPDLNPKVVEFCRHYGTVILPARPYRPRDKGKVESSVKYVKNNALKGRQFPSLADENRYLLEWEQQIADQRIHGTTREQVARRFEAERSALLPLPASLFASFQEARRHVHRDGHVEVARAYYEVPEEYLCRLVWVRWDGRTVRVFNDRFEQVAVHAQAEPGRFRHLEQTSTRGRLMGVERSAEWLVSQALRIGPCCGAWAEEVWLQRGVEGIRPLQGLRSFTRKYSVTALEKGCRQALELGRLRLPELRQILEQPDMEITPSFLETHPLIRDLAEYGAIAGGWTAEPPELPTAPPTGCVRPFGGTMDNSSLARVSGG